MEADATLDPGPRRFRDAVVEMYGPDVDRVVLFGSRGRGDGRAGSDVAIFLRTMDDRMAEWDGWADSRRRFLVAGGPFFDAKAESAKFLRLARAMLQRGDMTPRDVPRIWDAFTPPLT